MTRDDEPLTPRDNAQIDDWIELMLHSSPAQSGDQHDLPDPQLLRMLQALCQDQAQTVNDRVNRVWRRLEAHARLPEYDQRREQPPVRPVFRQERQFPMQRPMQRPLERPTPPVRARRRWPARLAALAAAVLLVALVGGLVAGLILVRHPGGQTAQPKPSATRAPSATAPAVTPTPDSSLVPDLENLTMLDAQHGWALNLPEQVMQTPGGITISSTNQYRVLATGDGGSHWQDVTPPLRRGLPVTPDFVTASLAWVFAGTNQLYMTSDGGQTWQQVTTPVDGRYSQLVRFTFLDAQNGWMILASGGQTGSAALFQTTDGGLNWTKLQSTDAQGTSQPGELPLKHIEWLTFLDASTGWATGENAKSDGVVRLYATHDGGATWQPQSAPLPATGFTGPTVFARAPQFFNAQDGILDVASDSAKFQPLAANLPASGLLGRVIYVTHDGGATWQSGALLPDPGGAVAFGDAAHGWVAASYNRNLWATSDGGSHWARVPVSPNFSAAASALVFVSSQTGWAERNDSVHGTILLKTEDGGRTWTPISYTISG